MPAHYPPDDWHYAHGGPGGRGVLKQQPADFVVEELLPFVPEGCGEHVFLHIENANDNTGYIARSLARLAGVRSHDVGFAGLKDRYGLTRQWFSVWLPGKSEPDWQTLQSDHLRILTIARHARKLKRGSLSGNRFTITIRDFGGDRARCERQLQAISAAGFPNYFGEQRFGHGGTNITGALALFAGAKVGRELRSLYLSAARSLLFNRVLSERVKTASWNTALPGDLLNLAGTNSRFACDCVDEVLLERLQSGDIHPTGPMWGLGELASGAEVAELERQIAASAPELSAGLAAAGLLQDRRSLRVIPKALSWRFADTNLQISFELPAGSYATALLREIVELSPADNRPA
ncbi:tRNA pseudouridine(13) synthase TruD [Methylomonas sp. HYX-M1]|uniref:tRNA pseudouridine(13) synthase TruD n=1 Tax=Methylomonas sp. HYX-M1 TaxID=3139307 RepID=UPI00345B9001